MANQSIYKAFEQMWNHIVTALYGKSSATNLVNGSAAGSLRGVYTDTENDDYIMGDYAFAEGLSTTAFGEASHAEGSSAVAVGKYSHAEGKDTIASGYVSHAEGHKTVASEWYSHAEGNGTKASGNASHAEGYYTTANSKSQHVQGEYNILDTENANDRGTYAHIVGNGTSDSDRRNAHTLNWDGTAWFAGDVYVRGTGQPTAINQNTGATKLVTETQLNNLIHIGNDEPNPRNGAVLWVDKNSGLKYWDATTSQWMLVPVAFI